MEIGIIGYGKMGKIISCIAKERGHSTVTIDPNSEESDFKEINAENLKNTDICIDFTHPSVALNNIKQIVGLNKNLVVGTTGWLDNIEEVKVLVEKSNTSFLYSSNFSLGVNVFFKMMKNAAKIMNKFDQYDVSGIEFHHNQKADSPSGTAETIADILVENIDRKTKAQYDKLDRKIEPEELHFASLRSGNSNLMHEVFFDSETDTISLKHNAKNRNGYAIGSVIAAEWLNDKKGFFTIEDFIEEITG